MAWEKREREDRGEVGRIPGMGSKRKTGEVGRYSTVMGQIGRWEEKYLWKPVGCQETCM